VTPELATSVEVHAGRSAPATLAAGELARWSAVACAGLLLVAAVALAWRRLAGALQTPLSWQCLLWIGILLAAAAAAAHAAWRHSVQRRPLARRAVLPAGLITSSLLAIGGALSIPGTPPLGLVLFWGTVAGEELVVWGPRVWRGRFLAARRRGPGASTAAGDRNAVAEGPLGPKMIWGKAASADVVQQQIRSRAADGTEVLCGWLRVPLAAGQRSASVHVAFCPPFPRTPEVAVQQREGPAARIKAVQLLPHGARFDVRLAQPGESAGSVLLEFSAQSEPSGLASSEPDRSSPA
jgi:hypothetical protein